jgi:hypothetical protein
MSTLTIPAPTLEHDPPGAVAELEQPLTIKLPALSFPDGTAVTDQDLQKGGAFAYRRQAGLEEIWNEGTQLWEAPPAELSTLTPMPLKFKAGDPLPWSAVLAAAGQKDKNGADRFSKAAGGAPVYLVRVFISAKKAGVDYSGLSTPSDVITFVSAADNQRFGIQLTPDKGREAEKARVQLRTASRTPVGWVEIRATGGQEVEIVKCDAGGNPLSSVLLADDGSIHLRPASGREIVLEGDLRAQRVRYQRFSTGELTEL